MELPTATVGEIENDTAIDILGCVDYVPENEPERRAVRLFDREGEEFELTLFGSDSNFGLEKGEWYVFRDAEGDVYEPTDSIGITPSFGDMSVQHLSDPPEIASEKAQKRSKSTTEAPSEPVTLEDGTARAVVDIETVLADGVDEESVDLDDSSHVELLCVGVGYQPAPGLPASVDVLFRSDSSPRAEYDLLEAVCEWLETRDPESVLTYGEFDPRHLKGRAERLEERLEGDVRERLGVFFRDDRYRDVSLGVSLEDAADAVPTYWDVYDHGLDPTTWRRRLRETGRWPDGKPLDDPVMTNKDIDGVGGRYLELSDELDTPNESREYRALRELLRQYTAGDIEPVFQLA